MEIGKVGIIKNTNAEGWFIKIIDDKKNTGGYLLVQSRSKEFIGEGFDNWFENLDSLKKYITQNNIHIEWIM
ncbi:MAG: hypothetical protein FWF46_01880 [Oscillospiraceae bacterium]|nr:hypothetical protein [Oscillospiraceae bacterium]